MMSPFEYAAPSQKPNVIACAPSRTNSAPTVFDTLQAPTAPNAPPPLGGCVCGALNLGQRGSAVVGLVQSLNALVAHSLMPRADPVRHAGGLLHLAKG